LANRKNIPPLPPIGEVPTQGRNLKTLVLDERFDLPRRRKKTSFLKGASREEQDEDRPGKPPQAGRRDGEKTVRKEENVFLTRKAFSGERKPSFGDLT